MWTCESACQTTWRRFNIIAHSMQSCKVENKYSHKRISCWRCRKWERKHKEKKNKRSHLSTSRCRKLYCFSWLKQLVRYCLSLHFFCIFDPKWLNIFKGANIFVWSVFKSNSCAASLVLSFEVKTIFILILYKYLLFRLIFPLHIFDKIFKIIGNYSKLFKNIQNYLNLFEFIWIYSKLLKKIQKLKNNQIQFCSIITDY